MKRHRAGRAASRINAACALAIAAAFQALTPAAVRGVEHAFVVTTDYYSAAYYSTIEAEPPRTTKVSIGPVSSDPVVHYDAGEDMIFVINRYLADNIQIVEASGDFSTIGQYSVGNGANPHDIRLASSTKAYVSRYEWKTLLIVHPYTGDSLGVIDLSPLADSDGIPEMDRMEIVGGRLFVTLNSIDRLTWLPDGPGKVAVIDVEADTLIDCDPAVPGVQPIMLELPNPYSELRYDRCQGELVVGCLGAWGTLDGGIETVDPVALETKGIAMSEAEFGGDISDAVLGPGGKGYAVVLDPAPWPDNYARLVGFDRASGVVTDTLCQQTSGMGSSLATIELSRQREIYLCDRDMINPGVRIFDTLSDTLIALVDVGLPPFDIALTQQPMAGTYDIARTVPSGDALLAGSHPNPFRGSTEITYTVPSKGLISSVRLSIYDPLGRLICTIVDRGLPAGTYGARWDGTDWHGRLVAGGVYFCRVCVNGQRCSIPLILAR